MELFKVNDLLEFINENRTERILWISPDYYYCFTIVMYEKTLLTPCRNINELEYDLYNNLIEVKIPQEVTRREDKLTEKSRKNLEDAWGAIKDVISLDKMPDIFNSSYRSKMVKKITDMYGFRKTSVYKYLRKYWQGGMLKIALSPDYKNCGGKGKEKSLGNKKIGRPNDISVLEPEKIGVNISDEDKKRIRIIMLKYNNKHKDASIPYMYDIFKEEFYSEWKITDGERKRVPLDDHKIITEYQFKYWYYRLEDAVDKYERTQGKKKLNLKVRGLKSNAKFHAFGPGYRYEIDSTISPFYLLNRMKNEPVGKPVVYFVVDTYSTFIVGIYVGIGHASWEGASLALYNCTEDKVTYCKKFGVDIKPEQWPNAGLPHYLLADRGELIGVLPEKAIENLNICLENTPSFRADMKGTVENNFGRQENKLKPFLDGVIEKDYLERGGTDARKNARMDIEEFTRSMIRAVIHHNNHLMEKYVKTQQMVDDKELKPTPAYLFNWGLRNISGSFRTYPENYLKANLMRRGKASITDRGIKFHKIFYDCEIANLERWYSKARLNGTWKVDICYTDMNNDYIYIINDESEFIKCKLKEEYSIYFNRTTDEINSFLKSERSDMKKLRHMDSQNDNDLIAGLKEDVDKSHKNYVKTKGLNLKKNIKRGKSGEIKSYGRRQALELTNDNNVQDYPELQHEDKAQEVKLNTLANRLNNIKRKMKENNE